MKKKIIKKVQKSKGGARAELGEYTLDIADKKTYRSRYQPTPEPSLWPLALFAFAVGAITALEATHSMNGIVETVASFINSL